MLYSCIGITTIVGQEDTPQVGSLLPIDLGLLHKGIWLLSSFGLCRRGAG